MTTVWLDVTTILGWNRPAVGIVRVESECALYALEKIESSALRFCRYDGEKMCYVEVQPSDVLRSLERIRERKSFNSSTPQTVANPQEQSQYISREQRFKAGLLRAIKKLPLAIQRRALSFSARRKPALQAAFRAYREGKHAAKEFIRPSTSMFVPMPQPLQTDVIEAGPSIPFKTGDVYISVGLDWDQKYLVYLYEQKKRIGFKTILFCYDIIPVKFPHLCVGDVAAKFAKYFADVAWSADLILCISEQSRRDLIELLNALGAPTPETDIVKLGSDIRIPGAGESSTEVTELLDKEYVLFVSTIERRKNHETLYRAYTRLIDKGVKNLPLLVFVGMPGWGVNDLLADLRFDPRVQPYIRILNHVSDEDLARLYMNCYFTVYPSLYEGWGLPVAESLAYGKFCLASNVASIPEVGGNLIDYLDPWDVPAWAERLEWYFLNPGEITARCKAISSQYAPVRWSDTGAQIFDHAFILKKRD